MTTSKRMRHRNEKRSLDVFLLGPAKAIFCSAVLLCLARCVTAATPGKQTKDTTDNVSAGDLESFAAKPRAFTSPPSASPNPGIAGLNIQFSAPVNSNLPVTYEWNFNDGSTDTNSSPVHVFAASGTFTVTVTVTDTSGAAIIATIPVVVLDGNSDSDGDGFTNGVEVALLSNPLSASSTPFNLPPPTPAGTVDVQKIRIQLFFGQNNADQIFVSGKLPFSASLQTSGQVVIADIGGVVRAFTLDASGNASVSGSPYSSINDTFKLRGIKGSSRRFQLRIGYGMFQQQFSTEPSADQNLTGETAGQSAPRVRVTIYFNGGKYESIAMGHYTVTRYRIFGLFTKK